MIISAVAPGYVGAGKAWAIIVVGYKSTFGTCRFTARIKQYDQYNQW
jgi:hypothetical protein